ncbi:hypothetical protein GCM10010517_63820 [Streptosporangium fragile]|uniref:Uncharacterized protein n=1 Tax=Streptosporangium fragile TaxID=46186 RepID=A0ABP6IP48_9ACTN
MQRPAVRVDADRQARGVPADAGEGGDGVFHLLKIHLLSIRIPAREPFGLSGKLVARPVGVRASGPASACHTGPSG